MIRRRNFYATIGSTVAVLFLAGSLSISHPTHVMSGSLVLAPGITQADDDLHASVLAAWGHANTADRKPDRQVGDATPLRALVGSPDDGANQARTGRASEDLSASDARRPEVRSHAIDASLRETRVFCSHRAWVRRGLRVVSANWPTLLGAGAVNARCRLPVGSVDNREPDHWRGRGEAQRRMARRGPPELDADC